MEDPASQNRPEEKTLDRLTEAAREAAERAYAPYSRFRVGAAALDESGGIHSGCNVENASYGLTICAERNAVAAAIASGARRIRAIAIFTPAETLTPPCGACRQVAAEFADDDMPVLLINQAGKRASYSLGELLPSAFRL